MFPLRSKRYCRANGRNRKRWERGRGENGPPHPHRFLFRPCADVRLLAKHTKKTPATQARGERKPRKQEAEEVDGAKGDGKQEGNAKR